MQKAKYIVLTLNSAIIVFPEFLKHDSVAKNMTDFRMPMKEQIVSAGFCQVWSEDGEVQYKCFGRSQGLDLEADEDEDSALLKRLFESPF